MTKLTEALKAAPRFSKGPKCSISALLLSLPADERKALSDAVNGDVTTRPTASALSIAISSAYGKEIHRASIDRHRRRECLCARRESR